MLSVTGRVGSWVERFNITIKRIDERPDNPSGDIVYRVKDIFTTSHGSWIPSDKPGSVEQWAVEKYLRSEFDDAGGAVHLFGRVLDLDGNARTDDLIYMWSDGFDRLGDPNYDKYFLMDTKKRSGWGNQPITNKFDYLAGKSGAWCWCPKSLPSEVVCGGGLPGGEHVSTFVVWQAEKRNGPQPPDEPGALPGLEIPQMDKVRERALAKMGLQFDRDSKFAHFARIHELGGPLTNEFEADGFKIQGFVGGIVCASLSRPDDIQSMIW